MTTFEYFKERYDKQHDYFVKCINPEIPVDSFHFVQVAWRNFWGGTTNVDPWFNINGVDDTKEMFEAGYLKKWDDCSWYARHTGTDRHVALNAKGLKAFYKAMFGKENK
jgi:hypothetical protein